ncbi:hypothetical protein ABZS79_15825 [Streptomyces griseoloalbus]
MSVGEDDLDATSGLGGNFVCGVLYEFEELTIPVSALRNATFAVGVFRNETGVDLIRLQDTR